MKSLVRVSLRFIMAALVAGSLFGCSPENVVVHIDGIEQHLNVRLSKIDINWTGFKIYTFYAFHFTCPAPEDMPHLDNEVVDAALRDGAHMRIRVELHIPDSTTAPRDTPIDLSAPNPPALLGGTLTKGRTCEARIDAHRGTVQIEDYDAPRVQGSIDAHFEVTNPENCTPEDGPVESVDLLWENFSLPNDFDELPHCPR